MGLGTKKGHGKGKSREKGKGKGKSKGKGRKGKEKRGERKARERATAGKESEVGGTIIMIRGGQNLPWLLWSLLEMGGHKKAQCPQWQGASSDGTQCNGETFFTVCCF